MARTDDEVVEVLLDIYRAEFGGRTGQRYLISWGDLRAIYGFGKLFESRLERLIEVAVRRRLYLFDLGEGENGRLIVVVRRATVDRWRRVPRRIIDDYRLPVDEDGEAEREEE